MSISKQLIIIDCCMCCFYIHVSGATNTMINFVDKNHPNLETQYVTDGVLPWIIDYQKTLSN